LHFSFGKKHILYLHWLSEGFWYGQ
jgi:hypothetical protein